MGFVQFELVQPLGMAEAGGFNQLSIDFSYQNYDFFSFFNNIELLHTLSMYPWCKSTTDWELLV